MRKTIALIIGIATETLISLRVKVRATLPGPVLLKKWLFDEII
jgi:hypothetical protein